MKRIKITLSDSTAAMLDEISKEKDISKSNYIGLLIQNANTKKEASSNQELIQTVSNIELDLRALICRKELDGVEKLKVLEYAKDIKQLLYQN